MCGIAGFIDLAAKLDPEPAMLRRMASAIQHRGPDEEGFFLAPGVGLASQRLSIVGLGDGQQPVYNEDGTVVAVYNGELFDFVELRESLRQKGHVFKSHCDTELLVHLWEEYGEQMFLHLHGQFAFALYDRKQQIIVLARDRVGICPLHWGRTGNRIWFASEIKAILASGQVTARLDPFGLDQMFTFFAMPGRRTMFDGISAILPGHFLRIRLAEPGSGQVAERRYWDFDFPDRGEEFSPEPTQAVDGFRQVFERAVAVRLRADVPVVSYLSGGVDSATVAAVARKLLGRPLPTFTVQLDSPKQDESRKAQAIAQYLGCSPTFVRCDDALLAGSYPRLVQAAEAPVMDTACACLYNLSKCVHDNGYKVALTGEGADEALAGYPWFKITRLLQLCDFGSLRPSNWIRRLVNRITNPSLSSSRIEQVHQMIGGPQAAADLYFLFSMNRDYFYDRPHLDRLNGYTAFQDIDIDGERVRRWHPLNQSIYFGYKTILPGLLLSQKGDRVAMANSVETRYPFLDDDVIAYCSRLHPRWKLSGIRRDKVVLRSLAQELLPSEVAWRPKAMFRAPVGKPFLHEPPVFARQLLSAESLRKTGYFAADKVLAYCKSRESLFGCRPGQRTFLELGLTGILATQLWHHLFLGGGLCELPTWSVPALNEGPTPSAVWPDMVQQPTAPRIL